MAFEVYQSEKSDQFYFRLKAANGQIILQSEDYTTKSSAMNGVDSVKNHAGSAGNFEKREAKNGSPYFVLKASNGQIIGMSQMYKSEAARDNGIESVMNNASADAGVTDLTAG